MKAVTFSYDDGVLQDRRLVEIFNRYGLKATFNLNAGQLYEGCVWNCRGVDVIRMTIPQCKEVLSGHEIACHGLTHPDLTALDGYQLDRQIAGDKALLEYIFDTPITGMAYPGGTYSPAVEEVLRRHGLRYARTVRQTEAFDLPENFLELHATAHHKNPRLLELADRFLALQPEKPQLFYLWGHSYEFDCDQNWEVIEEFCRRISGHEDIFYGTNHQVLFPFFPET